MDEKQLDQFNQLLETMPGGIAKLVYDDMLTILYATDTFYSLIQNAKEKVNSKTSLALLRIVYSADIIYVTHQLAAQKNRKDNMLSINFRTLQQDGSFKWVMINGSRTSEVYESGGKSFPVYSCIATDITDYMMKCKKSEQLNDYHRTISELSRELFFEYEIATDTLVFTELFHEVFGRDAEIKGFRDRLKGTKLIHPEELPAVIKIFNSMMSGRKQARFEVRLIPKDGIPCCYLCYASIIFDENRNPYKVIGKLSIVNPKKAEVEAVPQKPQLDSLTKLCTKESAENMISEAMRVQDEDSLSALFIVHISNYKTMNEVKNALNEQNILVKVSDMLKSRFRSTDIIGRTGINEFIVYIKDIQSDRVICEIAENLCKEMENSFAYEHTTTGAVMHIGAAFLKGSKLQYSALTANANAALIMAKKSTKNSFEIFYGAING